MGGCFSQADDGVQRPGHPGSHNNNNNGNVPLSRRHLELQRRMMEQRQHDLFIAALGSPLPSSSSSSSSSSLSFILGAHFRRGLDPGGLLLQDDDAGGRYRPGVSNNSWSYSRERQQRPPRRRVRQVRIRRVPSLQERTVERQIKLLFPSDAEVGR